MLRDKNLQLTELQFYINNITRCLGIVVLLSESRQDHQWYNLIKIATLFTSQLSKNHNNIQQASNLTRISEHYTSPTQTLFLTMSPPTEFSTTTKEITEENYTIPTQSLLFTMYPSTDFATTIKEIIE